MQCSHNCSSEGSIVVARFSESFHLAKHEGQVAHAIYAPLMLHALPVWYDFFPPFVKSFSHLFGVEI
jgi:hypothetical protein